MSAFIEKYEPRDQIELEVVTEAAAARWRLKRLPGIETALFDLEMAGQQESVAETFEVIDEGARQALAFKALADESNSLALLNRYETRIRRSYELDMRELRRIVAERTQEAAPEPAVPKPSSSAPEVQPDSLSDTPHTSVIPMPPAEPPITRSEQQVQQLQGCVARCL